jgi:hypothetical protein
LFINLYQGSFSLGDIFKASTLKLALMMVGQLFGFRHTDKMGTCHADDILYLFK